MRVSENLEDFILFVFLHMGSVDGSLHPNERETILEKIKELFPDTTDFDQKFTQMESVYRQSGSEQAESMIKKTSASFSQIEPSLRAGIYAALFDIINANGRVHSEETQTLRILKSWLMPG